MKKRILYLIIACLVCAGQSAWAYNISGSVDPNKDDGKYYVLYKTTEVADGDATWNWDTNKTKSWEYTLDVPGGVMSGDAKESKNATNTHIKIEQQINTNYSEVGTQSIDHTNYVNYTFNLNNTADKVRVSLIGSLRQYYKNLKVTLATYLEGAPASVTLPEGKVGGATFTTFSFKWCNLGGNITIKSNNPLFTLGDTKQTEISLSAPAGSWNNNQEVKVTCSNTSAGKHTGTIEISGGGKPITVTVISNVTKNDATITWKIPENVAVGEVFDPAYEAPVALTSFTSTNENVLKIEGTKVTAVGAGTATLTASIEDNDVYNDVEKSIFITVADKERQTIVWDQNIAVIPTSTTTTTKELTAYAVSSSDPSIRTNLPITYTSSNPSVASVSGNILTIHGVGSTDIKASVEGDDTYFPAYMTKGVVVYDPDEACPDVFLYDSEFQVAIGAFEGDKSVEIDWDAGKAPATLTFSAQSNEELWVDNETTIEVAQKNNSNWSNIQTVTVKKQSASTFADIKLDRQATAIRFLVKWNASGTTVTFSNVEVKQLRYLESDATTITFSPINLGASDSKNITLNYSALQSMCRVTLAKEDKAFKLEEGITFGEGCGSVGTKTFTITFSSEGFTSADCATYENTILIKNSQGDEEMRIPIKGTVEQLRQTIDWVRETTTIHTIDEVTVPAQTTANLPITYASSDATTAYVNSEYKLVILKHGTVTITATAAGDNTYQAATPVEHTFTINPTPYTPTLDEATLERISQVRYGKALSELALTGTATDKAGNTVAGSFAFADPTIIPPAETTTEYEVIFTPSDLNYYVPVTITTAVTTIPREAQILTWNQNLSAIPNTTESITLNATVNTGLDLVYTTDGSSVITVEGNTLKIVGLGRATVTVTQAGTLDYLPISMSKIVEVYDPTQDCSEALLAAEANVEVFISMWLIGQSATHAVTWDNTKPTETLRFTVQGTADVDMYVDAYKGTTKVEAWKTIKLTSSDASYSYPLDAEITKVEFRINNRAAQDREATFANIEVTQESYMTLSLTEHDFGTIAQNETAAKEFSIAYSALPTVRSVRLEKEDKFFSLVNNEAFGSGCGSNGTETFSVQFSGANATAAEMNTTLSNTVLIVDANNIVQRIPISGSLQPMDWLAITAAETVPTGSVFNYLLYSDKDDAKMKYAGNIEVGEKAYYLMQVRAADDWHTFVAPFNISKAYVLEFVKEPANNRIDGVRDDMISKQNAAYSAFYSYLHSTLATSEQDMKTIVDAYAATLEGYAAEDVGVWPIEGSYELHEGTDVWTVTNVNGEAAFEKGWTKVKPSTMTQGKTYAMRFPWCEYCQDRTPWDYWTGKLLLFEGTAGVQTIYGSDQHAAIPLAPNAGEAHLTGNYTLADMSIEDAFVHNITSDMYERVDAETIIRPTTSVIYANIPAPAGKRAKAIARSGQIVWEDAEDGGNSGTLTGLDCVAEVSLRVMAQEGGFSVLSDAVQALQIYSIDGRLVYTGMIGAGEAQFFSVAAGMYVVRTSAETLKVMSR